MNRIYTGLIVCIAAGLIALVVGCHRDENVSVYRAPKEPPKTAAGAPAPMAGMTPAAADGQIRWTVPAGWQPLPAQEMRFASFRVDEGEPPLVLTVIPLGPVSGDVQANVNRWEQQLGLPLTPAERLDKIVTRMEVDKTPVSAVDLLGAAPAPGAGQQRMLAAMANTGQKVWFFKLTGPTQRVAAQKAKFEAFLKSIHFGGDEP